MTRSPSRGRWGRWLAALAAALVLPAALSVAALSSSPSRPLKRGQPAITTTVAPIARETGGPPVRAIHQTAIQRKEAQAIDATLRYTAVITEGSHRRREVALTFDDGPSQYTDTILRILARKHVPATFFIVGEQLNRFAPELRDELRKQMLVGDHTESHAWLAALDPRGQSDQIDDAALRVRHEGSPFPRLFRPPYGAFNKATLRVLRRLHMLLVLWSIDPQDWRRPGVGAIVSTVLGHARPGAIVLMHDGGGNREQTVKALPSIIDGLRRRHFDLVTVPRLISDDPPLHHQRLPQFTGA